MLQIPEGIVEVRKEVIYQKNYKSKYLVIYSIQSLWKQIDEQLQIASFQSGQHTKYISFKYTSPDIKLGTLHSNNISNIVAKYEVLYNININDKVSNRVQSNLVRDLLLNALHKENQLFLSAKQGSGKYSNDILVIPNPKCKYNAHEWIFTMYSNLKRSDINKQLKSSF